MEPDNSNCPDQNDVGWWTRERTLALVLVAATALALFLSYLLVRPFLAPLAWALAIAVIAHPLHTRLSQKIPYPNLSAGLALLIIAALLVTPTVFIARQIVLEINKGIEVISERFSDGTFQEKLENTPVIGRAAEWLSKEIDLGQSTERLTTAVTSRVPSVLKGSIWGVVEMLITFFFLFYFFRDRRTVLRGLRALIPLSTSESNRVFKIIEDTIFASIYGTVVVGLVQGVLGGLIFFFLGLPSPVLWGFVMAALALIPILGAFIVWIPAAIYLAAQGGWGKALILIAWGSIVIGLIDNLLYPVLVGKRMHLHTLPVFIAIVGGVFVFGASGLILGPVILAVTNALMEVWRHRTAEGGSIEDGVH